jgi:hypothetical protein
VPNGDRRRDHRPPLKPAPRAPRARRPPRALAGAATTRPTLRTCPRTFGTDATALGARRALPPALRCASDGQRPAASRWWRATHRCHGTPTRLCRAPTAAP